MTDRSGRRPIVEVRRELILGFLRPASLGLTPFENRGRQLVSARFACEALQFDYGETLKQMEELTNARP